ncbi:MAG: DsrE family protein [Pirellulales bacterium]|nr:DsrE family protein [Pirellulales bacterium]
MKKLLSGCVAAAVALATVALLLPNVARCAKDSPEGDSPKPTLVVNLTSGQDDLHAVVMAFHFAEHGLDDGREVVVFFNVASPPLACKNLDASVKFREMPPVRAMVAHLLNRGAKIVVCPLCAKITGVTAEELAPGIAMIKDRRQIFGHLHGEAVVFSY